MVEKGPFFICALNYCITSLPQRDLRITDGSNLVEWFDYSWKLYHLVVAAKNCEL